MAGFQAGLYLLASGKDFQVSCVVTNAVSGSFQ
jgi:hypothetical protein